MMTTTRRIIRLLDRGPSSRSIHMNDNAAAADWWRQRLIITRPVIVDVRAGGLRPDPDAEAVDIAVDRCHDETVIACAVDRAGAAILPAAAADHEPFVASAAERRFRGRNLKFGLAGRRRRIVQILRVEPERPLRARRADPSAAGDKPAIRIEHDDVAECLLRRRTALICD